MNNKLFLNYVRELRDLEDLDNTLSIRWRKHKLRRKIKKLMKEAAKKQASIIYNQTMDLYTEILTSNLK